MSEIDTERMVARASQARWSHPTASRIGERQANMVTSRVPRKRFLLLGGSCAVIAASAVIFWQVRRGAEAAPAGETTYFKSIGPHETPAAKSAAHDVRRQPVEAVVRNLTLRLTGSLAADEKSEVGSNAAGNVSETRVERGSFVKKGDVLVQIDPRDAQNALDEGINAAEELRVRLGLDEAKEFRVDEVPEVEAAKVAMDLAERTFHRSEALKKQNAIALESYDQSVTDYHAAVQRYYLARRLAKQVNRCYRSAVTHLATLRKAVDDCTIRAPWTAGSPNGTFPWVSGLSPFFPAPSWSPCCGSTRCGSR